MTSLAALRTRIERAYANERAEVMHRVDGPTPRDVSTWLAGVSFGECVALFEALAAAEAERDALRTALAEVDRLASVAHDAIWHPDVQCDGCGFDVLHANDRDDSAQSAIWAIHAVARDVLAAPVPAAPPTKETP